MPILLRFDVFFDFLEKRTTIPSFIIMSPHSSIILPDSSESSSEKVRSITSPQNANFKRWMSLCGSKGIAKHQECLVSGEKIIREILAQHATRCREYLYPSNTENLPEFPEHVVPFRLTHELFQRIDVAGTSFPILICQAQALTSINLAMPPEGLEVLCPLGDPINLGTVIRSCSAFGVQKLILLDEAAHPFHPKAIRASSGAVFNQTMFQGPGIRDLLDHETNKWIVSLDLNGKNLSTWNWPRNIRLLVGEEGLGLPDGKFQRTLTIPQAKGIESLNAAIATSIALFAYRQQFPLSAPV